MRRFLIPVLLLWVVTVAASAGTISSLGYREDTIIVDDSSDDCIGTQIYNHDNSFENGYCWQLEGSTPPYYGAWGEAFDVGPATIECELLWLTGIGFEMMHPPDIYIWAGGISTTPAGVIAVVPHCIGLHIPFWPTCLRNEIEIGCYTPGEFTAGCWFDYSQLVCEEVWVCADESGIAGHPWTCIAPGIGYPSGWQHPRVVYPNCVSMGIGATVTCAPSPVESRSWGAIKDLYR